ncbi:MAG: DNA replication protein [Alphaproteobacteria bacterium]|nr:DNA replication protein [Alphaproteobacteria bacterium]
MNARQLPLALPFAPALGRGDFILAASNRAAVAALDRWPDWPRPGLLLCGPEACGKSHLVEIWRQRSGAPRLTATELPALDPTALADGPAALALEDLGAPLGDEAELALFRLYNLMLERRGSLLLTARTPPAAWSIALADLRSRVNALTAIAIGSPEDELIDRLLSKLFADRQVSVDPETLGFARLRMERSCAAARRLVEAVDHAALAQQRPITVPLVRAVLEEVWPNRT